MWINESGNLTLPLGSFIPFGKIGSTEVQMFGLGLLEARSKPTMENWDHSQNHQKVRQDESWC
jgi:hypothetical protein